MLFILPTSHEEGTIQRLPVVTLTIIGLCLAIFLGTNYQIKQQTFELAQAEQALNEFSLKLYMRLNTRDKGSMADALIDAEAGNIGEVYSKFSANIEEFTQKLQQGEILSADDPDLKKYRELEAAVQAKTAQHYYHRFGFTPNNWKWYQFISCMFFHAGWLHIIGNLFFLYLVGCNLEDRLGRLTASLLYLSGGIVATLTHVLMAPGSSAPMIGASGAISAFLGLFLIYFARTRIKFFYIAFVAIRPLHGTFRLPAYIALPFWFIQQLFMAMMNLDNSGQGGVAFFAHLGGFVFGVGAGLLLRYAGFDHKIAELIDPDMLAKPRDFRVGMKLLDQGQFRAGLAKLQKAQAANPDDSDILDSLFRCYISQNQSDLAFQAGSKLLPMLLRQRQDELAWPVYEEMLKIKPNYTPGAAYLLRLGRICEHRHDWGQAAAIYEQISQSPMSAQNRESVTEAARRLSEIQAQHPSDSPEPWPPVADMAHPANLNVSLAEQKPTGSPLDDLALPQTELAWSETPEARSLSYEIESGYSENQAAPDQTQADQGVPRPNLSKAERVVPRPNLSKTATNPPIPPAIPAEIPPVVSPQAGPMVRIALPLRKRIEAQETLLQKNPDNLSARIALGLAYQESGQAEKAREHFEAALRLKPDNAYVLARLRLLTPGAQQNSPYLKEIFSKPKDDPRETRQTKIILISSGGTLLVLIAFLLLKIFFLNGAYPISSPTAISSDPAWSPSGDALAFIGHERNADEPHLFVSEKRAEPQQIPLPDDIRMITAPIIWSPGGNKLLLRAHNDESALLLIIGRDGASPQIIPHAIDAAWSPDGHRLIYAAESDHYENNRISLNFFDLATATSQKVEVGEIGEIRAGNFQRAGLFWSTRANRIYFTAAKSLQPASVAPADEEEVMRQARQMMRQAILGQTQPYVRQYDQQIFEYEVSTTEVVGLTEGANHSLHGLSPDGQILLYGEENDDGREDIYTLDLPSQTRHKIIPAAALGDTPSISFRFDLKTIIFDGLIGQSSGMIPPGMGGLVNLRRPTDIFRVGIDGQNLERIETRHIAKSAPVASPVDRRIAYIMREMDGSSRIWVLRGW